MKTLILFLFAFLHLNAIAEIEVSNLELSNMQVISMERVENRLFLITNAHNSIAKLDVYDIEKNTLTNGFLYDEGLRVTFGNSNMFKDSENNLLIGDVNRLYIIDKNNKLTDVFNGYQVEDSSYFEVKSFTEDEKRNIYFLKRNFKMLVKNENGPGSFGESNVEVWKLDINKKLQFITRIENSGIIKNDIYYHDNKIFFSVFSGEFQLFCLNLSTNLLEKYDLKKIDIPILENFGKSEIKIINIEKILLFQDNLFYFTQVTTKGNYTLGCLIRHDFQFNNFEVFTIVNDDINEPFPSTLCVFKDRDRIILACLDIYGKTRRRFSTFNGKTFEDIDYDATLNKPKLITSESMKNEISAYPSQFNFKSGKRFHLYHGMYLLPNGTLFGATDQGLIILENFLEPIASVKNKEFIINTIPELTNVKNELFIESEYNINSYKVFDINSKMLQTQSNLNSNNINLNLEGLTIGIYFIEIETQKGSKLLKFIKN